MKRRAALAGIGGLVGGSALYLYLDLDGDISGNSSAPAGLSGPASPSEHLSHLSELIAQQAQLDSADIAALSKNDSQASLLASLQLGSEPLRYDAFAQRLNALIKQDYAAGKIDRLNGWWLSRSELMLLAMTASSYPELLSAPPPEKTFQNAPEAEFLDIVRWGPQRTDFGVAYNQQPDGHAGLWIIPNEPPPRSVEIYMGETWMKTTINDEAITTALYNPKLNSVITTPGEHQVWAYDKTQHVRQLLGTFTVGEAIEFPQDFERCAVMGWGPQQAIAGEVFNKQPSGNAALWIQLSCYPEDTVVYFGDTALATTQHDKLLTATVPANSIPKTATRIEVSLRSESKQASKHVGHLELKAD